MQQFSNNEYSLHKNYSEDQLTGWIPGTKKPERPGRYQLRQGKQLFDGEFNGAQWVMFQGISRYPLNEFQLKSVEWRGLKFKPSPTNEVKQDCSKGWVFSWSAPGGPRPLTEND